MEGVDFYSGDNDQSASYCQDITQENYYVNTCADDFSRFDSTYGL